MAVGESNWQPAQLSPSMIRLSEVQKQVGTMPNVGATMFSVHKPAIGQPESQQPNSDELWMQEALRLGQRALEAGEVPVGAIVVHQSEIVGRGFNRNIKDSDPTAHAEIMALREAGATLGNHRLADCTLFVTIEPCAMCAGAMVHARVRRLIFGAYDPKAGAVRSALHVLNHPRLNHKIEVRGGVMAGRCAEILQEFFRRRR